MFRRFWQRWKEIAHIIGVFQSRLLLNAFYYLILMPFGLGVRCFSDPLHLARQHGPQWHRKEGVGAANWERAKREF